MPTGPIALSADLQLARSVDLVHETHKQRLAEPTSLVEAPRRANVVLTELEDREHRLPGGKWERTWLH